MKPFPIRAGTQPTGKTESAQWSINGRFLSQPLTGVQRYAEEITRALDHLVSTGDPDAEGIKLELLCPPDSRPLHELASIKRIEAGRGKGHAWEQLVLPFHTRGGLLSLGNTGPLALPRQIVCIHDANTWLFPKSYSRSFRAAYRVLQPALARRAALIATVSQYSASRLKEFGIAPPSKITVIPNGHEHIRRWKPRHSAATLKAAGRDTVVLIGSPAPHKNLDFMLRLASEFKTHGLKLAIAGSFDAKVYSTAPSTSPFSVEESIVWLGRVSDGELAALLKDSLCLAFPSYEEGFGLPALEAMALGCPVVASNKASIPEVCAEGALYASPDDGEAWISAFLQLRQNNELRRNLSQKGELRAGEFSWVQSARLYLRAMRGLH